MIDKGSSSRTLLDIPILPDGISPEYRKYYEYAAAFGQWKRAIGASRRGKGGGGGGRGLGRTRARDLLIYRRAISFVCSTIERTEGEPGHYSRRRRAVIVYCTEYSVKARDIQRVVYSVCSLVIGRLGGGYN